jgi:hypothetical protein
MGATAMTWATTILIVLAAACAIGTAYHCLFGFEVKSADGYVIRYVSPLDDLDSVLEEHDRIAQPILQARRTLGGPIPVESWLSRSARIKEAKAIWWHHVYVWLGLTLLTSIVAACAAARAER